MIARSLRGLFRYARKTLHLESYLADPEDGRIAPSIPARDILTALLGTYLLRVQSALGVERLIATAGGQSASECRALHDDVQHYFTERLALTPLRSILYRIVAQAKANKAFDAVAKIGLIIDGTSLAACRKKKCAYCRPYRNTEGEILGYTHEVVAISVEAGSMHLLLDVEPYGPGDSEYESAQRLLARAMKQLGRRFADYLVVDGIYATAPFLHEATALQIPVIARLKKNIPTLLQDVRRRFEHRLPQHRYVDDGKFFEVWDADDFEPWEALQWESVRVVRYKQMNSDGKIYEAEWLTNLSNASMGTRALVRAAKSRWCIENQGFNDAKTLYHIEHMRHHETNSIVIHCLLVFLAMMIERLYRIRYLHRGKNPISASIDLWQHFMCHFMVHGLPALVFDSS